MNQFKPDIGLYQTKHLLRAWLRPIPGIEKLSPNLISLLALVPGLIAAECLFTGQWLGAILGILARMILNTLDGLIAEEFKKTSHLGAYLNRVPGEFTDILIAIGLVTPLNMPFFWFLVPLCGLVQVFGVLGLAAGAPGQSVGPCGQTDRLAIIALGSLACMIWSPSEVWGLVVPLMIIGCLVTIGLRIYRTIKALRKLDQIS
ncbi:MAG: CDP-alcohol phosphatidyltransferase family protein [Candidatus Caenarcaniphilales bacterium]|nr:CDP-alcohol phosphatidyltransferase family protein [Candidatus Caenarcaniphilales bacterium]